MKYSIIFTEEAKDQLDNLYELISKNNPIDAKKYVKSLGDKISLLADFPYVGKRIINNRFNYCNAYYYVCEKHIVIYLINEISKCVNILTILSHYQNWIALFDKD